MTWSTDTGGNIAVVPSSLSSPSSPSSNNNPNSPTGKSAHAIARDKFNRCVMLEFDAEKHKWRDVLRRTPRGAAAAARRTPPRGLSQKQYGLQKQRVAIEPVWATPSPWAPVLTGLALLALPPIGVAMVWSSPRYDATAKLALTIFSGFTMCLAAIVTIFALL